MILLEQYQKVVIKSVCVWGGGRGGGVSGEGITNKKGELAI